MWHTIPAMIFVSLALVFFYALETPPDKPDATAATELRVAPALEALPLDADHSLPPLAMIADKPVLINFFASWCTPCLGEHPFIKTLGARDDVLLYGIGWNDSASNIAAFLQKNGNPYDHVAVDEEGRTAIAYGITGVPESFLIDRQHRIAYHQRGPLTEDIIEKEIIPLLEKKHD